ncbi:MAG: hypothetical protein ACP5QO_00250 [Clostridia bacterium]
MEDYQEIQDGAVVSWDSFDEASAQVVARAVQLVKRVARVGRLPKLAQELNTFDASRLVRDGKGVVDELASVLEQLDGILSRTMLAPNEAEETEWARAFEAELRGLEVEFGGEYPRYEVFPFEIEINLVDDAAMVNKRTTHVLRPKVLAKLIQGERDRLFGARFNAQAFMRGMAEAYDLLIRAEGGMAVGVPLRRAYDVLILRDGSAAYPLRQFAFDLYRLRYQSDMRYRGRRFVLNPSRNPRGAVPVPRPTGGVDNLGSYELVEESR